MVNTVNVVAFLFKTKKQEKTTKTRLNTSLLRSQDLNYNIQQSVLAVQLLLHDFSWVIMQQQSINRASDSSS